MKKLKLHEILIGERLGKDERRAVECVYRFLKKSPSTIARISELAYEDKLFGGFPHHANYVNYAVDVLEGNGIIGVNSLGVYSVK